MYGIGFAFVLPIISAFCLIYAFGYTATGLVLARLIPQLRERYGLVRWLLPLVLMASAWMLFWVDPEWFIGITIGLAPLGGIGLILTRKMVPNWRPHEADVLDEVLIQSTNTSKHS